MPLYEYTCSHGHKRELLLPMRHRNDLVLCGECDEWMYRTVSVPAINLGVQEQPVRPPSTFRTEVIQ